MNKAWFIILSLTLAFFASYGQYQKKDSLIQVYQQAKHDTTKIFALKSLTWHHYFKSSDSSEYYLDCMIDLSIQSKFKKGLFDAYNIKGILYYTDAKYDSAIYYFNRAFSTSSSQAFDQEKIYSLLYSGRSYQLSARFEQADSCYNKILNIALKNNDSVSVARGYKLIAQNHYTQGHYQKALDFYFKADTFMIDDVSVIHAENFQNIGNVYHALDNHPSASSYYQEALKIYRKINDNYGENSILASLGSIDLEEGNYLSAKSNLENAHNFFLNYNDPAHLANIKKNLGRTEFNLGNFDKALVHFDSALTLVKDIKGSATLTNTFIGLGETHTALKNFEQAIYYHKKALQSAYKLGDVNSIALSQEALAESYYLMGDLEMAYETTRQNQNFKDSINDLKSDQLINELGQKYLTEKKEKEIELLKIQNQLAAQQKRNQLIIFAGLAVALTLLSVFLFMLYKNRQKITKKLQDLDASKSNFFANISHEFRTPLTLIKHPVTDQLAEKDLTESMRKRMEMIDRNTDRLLSLVDQLLDLSRLEAGSLPLKISEASIYTLVKALIPAYQYAAKQKGIDLNVSYSENDKQGWIDPDIVQKILSNLLSNAIKYSKSGGSITLSIDEDHENIRFTVQNQVAEPHNLDTEKLFDRFYRGNETEQGTGIGLALVKELVELHRGSIEVARQNNELIFFILLPIRRETFRKDEIVSKPKHSALLEKPVHVVEVNSTPVKEDNSPEVMNNIDENEPMLLIVEDNIDLATLISDQFKKHYQILIASDGEEGIRLATEYVPDLVISDIMMPGKDGIELAQILKKDERTSHIPIILLTAKMDDADRLKGIDSGADDYLVKPFNKEILALRVDKLIEQRVRLRKKYVQEVVLHPREIAITSVDEKFLQRIQNIIDHRLTDSDFNSEVFSKEMNMSRMQLHRKLRALLGVTATEFIRKERLKIAAQILTESKLSVSEVGYAVGFNNISYFTRCFKEVFGVSPKAYVKEKLD